METGHHAHDVIYQTRYWGVSSGKFKTKCGGAVAFPQNINNSCGNLKHKSDEFYVIVLTA